VEYCQKEFQNSRDEILLLSENGSGLNEARRGYLKLIDLILAGKVGCVVRAIAPKVMVRIGLY